MASSVGSSLRGSELPAINKYLVLLSEDGIVHDQELLGTEDAACQVHDSWEADDEEVKDAYIYRIRTHCGVIIVEWAQGMTGSLEWYPVREYSRA